MSAAPLLTPPRPVPPRVHISGLPLELMEYRQWVPWAYELRRNKNTGELRWTKPPRDVRDITKHGDSSKPETWGRSRVSVRPGLAQAARAIAGRPTVSTAIKAVCRGVTGNS